MLNVFAMFTGDCYTNKCKYDLYAGVREKIISSSNILCVFLDYLKKIVSRHAKYLLREQSDDVLRIFDSKYSR